MPLNIMLDLETSASRNDAGILSIGAVAFPNNSVCTVSDFRLEQSFFYRIIDLESQRDGFSIDASTFYWWLRQSQKAREEIGQKGMIIRKALYEFTEWYRSLAPASNPEQLVKEPVSIPTYSYGSTFDNVILQHAYDVLKLRNPIHYRNQLCMRTIVQVSQVLCPQLEGLVGHNALDDAIRQAIWLQLCFQKLRTKE